MKQFKKTFVALAIAFATFTVSAQTSNTSSASNSFFETDVDYFMDENNWNKVKPENGFGYFGMDYNSYQLGFAKQFDKVYWGTYFNGDFGDYEKTVEKSGSDKTITSKECSSDSSSISFYNLIGIDNIGLKLGCYYFNWNSSVTDDGTTKTDTDKAEYGLFARAGLTSATFANHEVQPYAWCNFYWNYDWGGAKVITTTKATDKSVTTDSRKWYLNGGVGGTFTLSNDSVKESYLLTYAQVSIKKPINKDEKENPDYYKYDYLYFYVPVTYKVVYKPSEQLSVGARTGIGTSFTALTTDKDNSSTTIRLSPYVYTGLQYDTLKKVILNAGVYFTVPNLSYTTSKNSANDTTTTSFTWNEYSYNPSLSFSSGFQFNPVKNLCIDCNYSILSGVLGNDLTTDFTEGAAGADIFWKNVNNALVHDISFGVSYKF